jgi:hypothetical protein
MTQSLAGVRQVLFAVRPVEDEAEVAHPQGVVHPLPDVPGSVGQSTDLGLLGPALDAGQGEQILKRLLQPSRWLHRIEAFDLSWLLDQTDLGFLPTHSAQAEVMKTSG